MFVYFAEPLQAWLKMLKLPWGMPREIFKSKLLHKRTILGVYDSVHNLCIVFSRKMSIIHFVRRCLPTLKGVFLYFFQPSHLSTAVSLFLVTSGTKKRTDQDPVKFFNTNIVETNRTGMT